MQELLAQTPHMMKVSMQTLSAKQKLMMKFLIKEQYESVWFVDPLSVFSFEMKGRDMWLLYVSFVVLAVLPQLLKAIWSSWSPLLEQASPKFIIKNFIKVWEISTKIYYLFQKQQTSYP